MDRPETNSGKPAAAAQPAPAKASPVPADAAMVRKIRAPAGISELGYAEVGYVVTGRLSVTARLTAGDAPEFEPFGDEDAQKIKRFNAQQKQATGKRRRSTDK